MPYLGISALYHDSAAALVSSSGEILAAAQEERFSRRRHDASWPKSAIEFCMQHGNVQPDDLKAVIFYEHPVLKARRIFDSYGSLPDRLFDKFQSSFERWSDVGGRIRDQALASLNAQLGSSDWSQRLLFCQHHASHAASAFYPSPFERALILTIDAVGEDATTTLALGSQDGIELLREIRYPHSLGLLYSAFTYLTGFKVNSGEYKMMGLAPYGKPRFKELIFEHLVSTKQDGSFAINGRYFDNFAGSVIIHPQIEELFACPRRKPGEPVEGIHLDIAASIQAVTEEVICNLVRAVVEQTGETNLCMAGGVALNCVANGRVHRENPSLSLWLQPAAGDAGGALGAALHAAKQLEGKRYRLPRGDSMRGAYLGPSFNEEAVEKALKRHCLSYQRLATDAVAQKTAEVLAAGKTVGWFQGAMEFGPRALGSRSILGDPRCPNMQRTLNMKVKGRESFRPFAPVVLRERVNDWFDIETDSPYMLMVSHLKKSRRKEVTPSEEREGLAQRGILRSEVPAVTHVDCSARVQTVDGEHNPLLHQLLRAFEALTGCPLLVNTSFNVRGEPIVCKPDDGIACFMSTNLDFLVMGSFLVEKEAQDPLLLMNYTRSFPPD
jgi:carbamoyltransferase